MVYLSDAYGGSSGGATMNTAYTALSQAGAMNMYNELNDKYSYVEGHTAAEQYTIGNWGSGEVCNQRWTVPETGIYYVCADFRNANVDATNTIESFQLHISASIDGGTSWFMLDGACYGSCSEPINGNMFVRSVSFFGYLVKDAIIKPYIHMQRSDASSIFTSQLFWYRIQTL